MTVLFIVKHEIENMNFVDIHSLSLLKGTSTPRNMALSSLWHVFWDQVVSAGANVVSPGPTGWNEPRATHEGRICDGNTLGVV